MPRGAATKNQAFLREGEFTLHPGKTAKIHRPTINIDSTPQDISQSLGLLVDLFVHVMLVMLQIDILQLHIQRRKDFGDLLRCKIGRIHCPRTKADDLVVLEVGDLRGPVEEGAGIGSEEECVLAFTDKQWTTAPSGNQRFRVIRAKQSDAETPLNFSQSRPNTLHEIIGFVVEKTDQMNEHFAIGLATELNSLLQKELTQHLVVFDHPVMYQCKTSRIIDVRVSILFAGSTVCCPTRVSNADLGLDWRCRQFFLQGLNTPHGSSKIYPTCTNDRNSRRVISPVLESLQALEEERCALLETNVTNNSTHKDLTVSTSNESLSNVRSPSVQHQLGTLGRQFHR